MTIRTTLRDFTVPVHMHKLAIECQTYGRTSHVVVKAPLGKRDVAPLRKYRHERVLTLEGIQSDSLEFIADWVDLRSVRLYSCRIGDWSRLAELKKLEDLFINTIRHRTPDLSFLSRLRRLTSLGIGYIPHWTAFPDMSRCTRLKRLTVFNCKRLRDLSAILHIPNLESFHIVATPQEPSDLEAIMAMPKMKFMTGAFGSTKKDALFRALMEKYGLEYGG